MVQVGDTFDTIHNARKVIKSYILTRPESYRTIASDKKQYHIAYKDKACGFKIRAYKSLKDTISIKALNPHTCSPATYYKMKQTSSVWHLILLLFVE